MQHNDDMTHAEVNLDRAPNPERDFREACNKQDKEEHDLAQALATLIDAVVNRAPPDFLEVAVRDGARALEQAYNRPWAELPDNLFAFGRPADKGL